MKAMAEGDLDAAREQMDKLAKKIAKNEMTEQEKQQLAKQLNSIQKKMNDLATQKNKEEMLKKLGEDGKLDTESLEREMSQLRQENEKLKDLQKLANKLNQCQQCMKAGDASARGKGDGPSRRSDQRNVPRRQGTQRLARCIAEYEGCPGRDDQGARRGRARAGRHLKGWKWRGGWSAL